MDYTELLPGFLQGITRVLISYPFDYLRVFKQTNVKVNVIDEIKKVNVFKGISFPLLSVPLDRAITFSMFEKLKSNGYSSFESSLYPSLLSSLYMTPINLLNTNYIYLRDRSIRTVLSENFNRNIFRGMAVEILRNNISSTLYLFVYKHLSDMQQRPFVNGALSSFAMWSVMYPLDTIKVHKFVHNKSYMDIALTTGFRNMYKGIGLLYLRTIPSSGCGMIVYEKTREYVNSLKDN